MKLSDFFPDDKLRDLIRLSDDLPEQFRTLAEQAHTAFSKELTEAEHERDVIIGETDFDVRTEYNSDGKLKYSNETARKNELERRLLENARYQELSNDIRRYKEDRNRLYRKKDECEMQIKAVLAQLRLATEMIHAESIATEVASV